MLAPAQALAVCGDGVKQANEAAKLSPEQQTAIRRVIRERLVDQVRERFPDRTLLELEPVTDMLTQDAGCKWPKAFAVLNFQIHHRLHLR